MRETLFAIAKPLKDKNNAGRRKHKRKQEEFLKLMKPNLILLLTAGFLFPAIISCSSNWEPRVGGIAAWSNVDTCIAVARNYWDYRPNNTGLGVGGARYNYYDISIYNKTGFLQRTLSFGSKKSNQNANCEIIYFMETAGFLLVRDANDNTGMRRWIKYDIADTSFSIMDSGSADHVSWIVPSTKGSYFSFTHILRNSHKDSVRIVNANNLHSIVSYEIPNPNAFVKWISDDTLIVFSHDETDSIAYQISLISFSITEIRKSSTFCIKPYTSSDNYSKNNNVCAYWDDGLIFQRYPIDSIEYCL